MQKKVMAIVLSTLFLSSAHALEAYGSIQLGVTHGYNHNPVPGNMRLIEMGQESGIYQAKRAGKRGLDVEDYGSYIGFKGQEELGNGANIIFDLRWAFDGAEGISKGGGFENEIAMLGIATSFGTLAIGRLENPYYGTVRADGVIDDFNALGTSAASAAAADLLFGEMDALNTFDADMSEYMGNALSYTSPELNGLIFGAAIIMTKGERGYEALFNKKRGIDIYTVNATYEHDSGFYSKIGYFSADLARKSKRAYSYGLQLGFRTETWGVTSGYARGENKGPANFGIGNEHS